MLKEIVEEATYFYHPDHLGSVSVVSNHQGVPYERVEYLPFGEVWIEEVDPATGYIPFRFTSKELDRETGLYYYGARYYEPKLSRWMSADPAGFALVSPMGSDGKPKGSYSVIEAVNWYAYVSNNPVKYVDPTGMRGLGEPETYLATVVVGTSTDGETVAFMSRNDNAEGMEGVSNAAENMAGLGWQVEKYETEIKTGDLGKKEISGIRNLSSDDGNGDWIGEELISEMISEGLGFAGDIAGHGALVDAISKIQGMISFSKDFKDFYDAMQDYKTGKSSLMVILTMSDMAYDLVTMADIAMIEFNEPVSRGTMDWALAGARILGTRDDIQVETIGKPVLKIVKSGIKVAY